MSKTYAPKQGEISEAFMAFMTDEHGQYQIIGPDGRGQPMEELPEKITMNGRVMTQFYFQLPSRSNPVGTVGYE